MDNISFSIIVALLVGITVGFLIAKAMEKAKEKKLLNGTKKRSSYNFKTSKNRCRIFKERENITS